MKRAQALGLLELDGGPHDADADTVRAAFNRRAKALHADKGGPGADMDQLKQARELLLNRRNVSEFACKQCGGKGNVPARMGVKPCGACKGTGETSGS